MAFTATLAQASPTIIRKTPPYLVILARTVMLGNDHGRTGGQAHEKAHQKVDKVSCGSAYGRQGLLSNEFSHDHGIRCVVKLLEKGSQKNRKEEIKKLFPDDALSDLVYWFFCLLHDVKPS